MYLQRFTVVAFPMTDLTGHIDIRQEMHLDLDDPVPAARLAPPAFYVEAEASFLIALRLRFGGGGEQTMIWFGTLIVLVTQIGVITPPVGVNVYVVGGIARDIPLQKIFRGAMPFFLLIVIAMLFLIFFPQLALWLPHLMQKLAA